MNKIWQNKCSWMNRTGWISAAGEVFIVIDLFGGVHKVTDFAEFLVQPDENEAPTAGFKACSFSDLNVPSTCKRKKIQPSRTLGFSIEDLVFVFAGHLIRRVGFKFLDFRVPSTALGRFWRPKPKKCSWKITKVNRPAVPVNYLPANHTPGALGQWVPAW